MRRFTAVVPALLVLLATLAVFVSVGPVLTRVHAAQAGAQITLAQQALQDDDILERIDLAITAVADSVRPSVVHIDVQSDDRVRSNGSGWVFDAAGHIITNAHVVRGASRLRVEFVDGRIVPGEVIGLDPYTDIAVLKVDVNAGLFALPRATGQPIRQGQRVFAFGSPFGFKFSMTQGVISGLGRVPLAASAFGAFSNYIQNDASVNPGNSGGPLVDVRGRVIGMNVAIATGRDTNADSSIQGDSAGISFAIPLETIETVVPQLISTGRVARGYLGLEFVNNVASVVRKDGVVQSGIRVQNVVPEGPAAAAGVLAGDMIVALRGQPVTQFEVLRSIVGGTGAGDTLPVEIVRDGEPVSLRVTLGEMPSSLLAQQTAVRIMEQLGARFDVSDSGPIVDQVWPGFPAASFGFEPGQRVIRVGDQEINDWIDIFIGFNEAGLLVGREVDVVVAGGTGGRRDTKTLKVKLNF